MQNDIIDLSEVVADLMDFTDVLSSYVENYLDIDDA